MSAPFSVGAGISDLAAPGGPVDTAWERHRLDLGLVNPTRRRAFTIIVVGTGLAGSAAAATLGELGYQVESFCFQDSPRRAHSVAAQGGINAAKRYRVDGDSVTRLFRDTLRGGDFRSREANVHRLAEISGAIIDQCVAQGVPFAREYGGMLDTRSFGGAQVSRTFYARGQTGQQLLLGAYQALCRQVHAGTVRTHPRTEMLDLIMADGRARGIVVRDLVTGELRTHLADAVVLATGGYSNAYYLSTNAIGSNATAIWRAHRRGALFANPCFTQIHPTCIPPAGPHQSKLTLMSESLRNDARVWVPVAPGDTRPASHIPDHERDYFLERRYPGYGNLVPRDIASRAVKDVCDEARGVGTGGSGVYLDLADAIARVGETVIDDRYGNVLEMYQRITGEDPRQTPMRIFPAPHFTMGGLWVDYDLMSTIPGLFVIGEANCADHGANRLGASALVQCLADGYFILPHTIAGYLAGATLPPIGADDSAALDALRNAHARITRLLDAGGDRSPRDVHREVGALLWEACGMTRNADGLQRAIRHIRELRGEFWERVRVTGHAQEPNRSLERAGRVADLLELAELMCIDALHRQESCGSHFRIEHTTADTEPVRDDERFAYVAAWEYADKPVLHREQLTFSAMRPGARSYR